MYGPPPPFAQQLPHVFKAGQLHHTLKALLPAGVRGGEVGRVWGLKALLPAGVRGGERGRDWGLKALLPTGAGVRGREGRARGG